MKPKIRKTHDMYGRTIRVLEGYKPYRIYVLHRSGRHGGYFLSTSIHASLDEMVAVDGEYWFGTLTELKTALENEPCRTN